MTTYFKIILALCLLSFEGFSQDCTKCKIQYEPSTKYEATSKTTSNLTVQYEGTQEIIDRLLKSGYSNPSTIESEQIVSTITKTDELNSLGVFPITFKILTSKGIQKINGEIGDESVSDPMDITLYGSCSQDGNATADSVVGEYMNEALKSSFIQIFSSVDNVVSFPEQCLQIGDSFTQESPIDIPMPGFEPIKMKIVSKYTLVKKEGKMVFFKVEQTYTLTNSFDEIKIDANGKGEGSMTVDTEKNYLTSNVSKTELNFIIQAGDLTINMKQESTLEQSIILSRN